MSGTTHTYGEDKINDFSFGPHIWYSIILGINAEDDMRVGYIPSVAAIQDRLPGV